MNQLLISIILSILPVSELRGGLPVAVDYALKNNISILPIFFLIVLLNIGVIFLILFFLDFFHESLMGIPFYKKLFGFYLNSVRKRADKIEAKIPTYGYLALTLFVAIPLPVTGAWTGTFIAWLLGLERKKSIPAIALGVLIAGIIILLASLGVFSMIR